MRHVLPADRGALAAAVRRCLEDAEPVDIVVAVRHTSGKTLNMRMIAAAIQDGDCVERVEGACQDITAQVRREQELATHRERLEELVEQRTRDLQTFAHALAHDLRAPIAAMAGFAQVVAAQSMQALDERSRHRLERIVANGHHAEALIDGILGMISRMQSPLHLADVDLTALAQSAIERMRNAEPHRKVEAVVMPCMRAHAAQNLLMSVIDNLVSNAWKFTSPREVARIEVGCRDDGAFYVRDNGVGFDPDRASRLFTPLHRLHDAAEFKGLGIGLATAYRIVLRHGGRMWAESQPGHGATFWFTLPAAA